MNCGFTCQSLMCQSDILLFVGLVPWWPAAALQRKNARCPVPLFWAAGSLILILYSLYLFAFFVYAYRLLPGDLGDYNHNFYIADPR